jgi:hypothetical protein
MQPSGHLDEFSRLEAFLLAVRFLKTTLLNTLQGNGRQQVLVYSAGNISAGTFTN